MKATSNKTNIFRRHHYIAMACVFALAVLLFVLVATHEDKRVNLTASMPLGVYQLSPEGPIIRGDFVSVCLDGEAAKLAKERGYLKPGSCPSGLQPLLKRVVGLPGDTIDLSSLLIRQEDSQGRPLSSSLNSGEIPDGFALVLAEHPGSYDGRYFGLVPLAALERVRPYCILKTRETK